MKRLSVVFIFFIAFACKQETNVIWNVQWECEVYPPEHQMSVDPTTGAKLIFVTTDSACDANFYFDLNCWTADQDMMAFISDRMGHNELFGYLAVTGEIVRFQPQNKSMAGHATVDYQTHDMYVIYDNTVFQWHFDITWSQDPDTRSKVTVQERKIASAPENTYFFVGLTESADGKYLSDVLGYNNTERQDIVAIDIESGEIKNLLSRKNHVSHIQYSKYNPYLLRFSHSPHRMWYIDTRMPGEAHKLHLQEPGELVTHEDWWVNDQMTFCGGYREEQSHVKIIDIHTQVTRILGAGSWWENGSPEELSKYNWWHASGAQNGRWVAADNWYGDIVVIDGETSHLRWLTKGHRTYGDVRVLHPHVGWAPDSKSVEFTSHQKGNCDVCIAYLPEEWNNPFVADK